MAIDFVDLDHEDGSDNTAGIQQYIYAAPFAWIQTLPKPIVDDSTGSGEFADLVTITDNIVMKAGRAFKKIYVTLEAGELKSELQGEMDGKSFLNSVEFFMPGSKAEVEGFRQWAKNSSLIFLVPEVDGQVRMLGHAGYPAKLVTNPGTTGKETSSRKGSTFTFQSARKGPAPIFKGKVDLTGGSPYGSGESSDFQDIEILFG